MREPEEHKSGLKKAEVLISGFSKVSLFESCNDFKLIFIHWPHIQSASPETSPRLDLGGSGMF